MAKRLYGLDALRGIAAVLVVLFHLHATRPFFQAAYLSVDLFFVISGYVMARTYERRMQGAAAFVYLRVRRLWAPMAFGCCLSLLLTIARGGEVGAAFLDFLLILMFLPSLPGKDGTAFSINGPVWSLFFELLANAMHATVFQRLHLRQLLFVILAAGVALVWATLSNGMAPAGNTYELMPLALVRCVFSYCVGIALFRSRWSPAIRPALAIFILPLMIFGLGYIPQVAASLIFILCLAPLIVASAVKLERPLLAWLGMASYPLYVVHYPIQLLPFSMPVIVLLIAGATSLAVWIDRWRIKASSGNSPREPRSSRDPLPS